jgi:hypothetical protein
LQRSGWSSATTAPTDGSSEGSSHRTASSAPSMSTFSRPQ